MARRKNTSSRIGVSFDERSYSAWSKAHRFCQVCGRSNVRSKKDFGVGLSTHHLVKFRRSHERCNLVRMCGRCHDLAEGLKRHAGGGSPLPKLTLAVLLTVKSTRDPGEYDPVRLRELKGMGFPEPLPIPPYFLAEFQTNRPTDLSTKGVHGNSHTETDRRPPRDRRPDPEPGPSADDPRTVRGPGPVDE